MTFRTDATAVVLAISALQPVCAEDLALTITRTPLGASVAMRLVPRQVDADEDDLGPDIVRFALANQVIPDDAYEVLKRVLAGGGNEY